MEQGTVGGRRLRGSRWNTSSVMEQCRLLPVPFTACYVAAAIETTMLAGEQSEHLGEIL